MARIKAEEEEQEQEEDEAAKVEQDVGEIDSKDTVDSSSADKVERKSKDTDPIIGGIFPKSSGGDLRTSVPGK